MRFSTVSVLAASLLGSLVAPLWAAKPSANEMAMAKTWVSNHFGPNATSSPFSFRYNGQSVYSLPKSYRRTQTDTKLDNNRLQSVITYSDPQTGLEIRCDVTQYRDYPAVEWVLHFANRGQQDTPVIENVKALDVDVTRDNAGDFIVHHALGSDVKMNDFAPLDDQVALGQRIHMFSGGTSSIQALPFFNVESVGNGGFIGAIGWSGCWAADFVRTFARTLNVQAGMDNTKLRLHPGEEIRTPRMLLMFWQGDRIMAHNQWRQLLLDYYSPRPGGQRITIPLLGSSWGALNEVTHINQIRWFAENKLPIECYWIDAGWSGKTGPIESWVENAATHVPNPEYFPHGLKSVSDEAHKHGMKFLLWVWPNRALPTIGIGKEHPEWLVNGDTLDHGNSVANDWMINGISTLITEQGMDAYRQDGNPAYPADASPDRQGINQIRHFEGFYQFWDALLAQHSNLMIDNCSGGGRKLDLETISRSVCLWRSDYQVAQPFDPIGMQGQTYGLSFWVPLTAGNTRVTDTYSFRSGYSPGMVLGFVEVGNYLQNFDYATARKNMNEYLSVRPCFYGDYYPLTPYSTDARDWMAWQFDRSDLGQGVIQAFRRQESTQETMHFVLRGLVPSARYTVKNFDEPQGVEMRGADLLKNGLTVSIKDQPGAVVIVYQKIK